MKTGSMRTRSSNKRNLIGLLGRWIGEPRAGWKRWLLLLILLAFIAALPLQVLAQNAPLNAIPPLRGWLGEYYDNPNLAGLATRVQEDSIIDFDWSYSAPAAGLPADEFSVRWTRSLELERGTYRFSVLSDDGVRVWINGELIIDEWHPASGLTYNAERSLDSGAYLVRIEYYEQQGAARIRFSWTEIVGPAYPDWRGQYYANNSLDGDPVLTRNDEQIDFEWGDQAPVEGLPRDDFSIRWTRQQEFPTAVYRFHVSVYGHALLWVDGALILDVRGQGSDRHFTTDHALRHGAHNLKVEYFEGGGSARIQVWWEIAEEAYPDWKGEYFNNRTLQGDPVMVRNDATPVFFWEEQAPTYWMEPDNFSIRWTRQQGFAEGTYELHAWSDDGVRVYVDGRLVIDEWHDNSGNEEYVVTLPLNGEHTIEVEYYEHKGQAFIRFWWVRS